MKYLPKLVEMDKVKSAIEIHQFFSPHPVRQSLFTFSLQDYYPLSPPFAVFWCPSLHLSPHSLLSYYFLIFTATFFIIILSFHVRKVWLPPQLLLVSL